MKDRCLRILIFIMLLLPCLDAVAESRHDKQIVAYYPNWQWYRRNHLVNPETIQYEKYTVINYAFIRPLQDGTLQLTDSWADENLLLGPMIWWPVEMHDSTRSLPYLAHQAGIKLLPSIGGWNDSAVFPGIAASPAYRQNFVQDCIELIQTYDFDGIDIDWEYPGYAEQGGTPADTQNFTTLLQELRAALDALSNVTGGDYLLTACFSANPLNMAYIDWELVLPLIDMVNLMSYDYHGPWDDLSNFNSPLYPPVEGNPLWCVDGSFTTLTDTYDVPPEMINVGIPFYGKALANCTGLYATHTGYDTATFPESEGQPHYYKVMELMGQFTYHWDSTVKCPWLQGNAINTFVSYDDTESVEYKARYARNNSALGVVIWELTGDYMETSPGSGVISGTPLLDSLIAVFEQPVDLLPPSELEAQVIGADVFLSWTAPDDSTGYSYNVYRNNLLLNPQPVMATHYSDLSVPATGSYSYYVTTLFEGMESEPSEPVVVTVTGSADETFPEPGLNLLSVYPNPFRDYLEAEFSARSKAVELSLYDTKGRLVKNIHQTSATNGKSRLRLDFGPASAPGLPAGVYLLRLQAGNKTITRKALCLW